MMVSWLVSRWCLGGMLVVSRWCLGGVSVVSRWCLGGVSVVSQWCLGGVSVVSLGCGVSGVSSVSSVVSQWYLGGVSKLLCVKAPACVKASVRKSSCVQTRLCKSYSPAAFIIIFSCVQSSHLLPPAFFWATLSSSFNLQRRFLLKNVKNT